MERIIYSSGEKGYGLYGKTEGFPDSAVEEVARLYNTTALLSSGRNGFSYCIRFSPLGENYLFSVIFKGIVSQEETRIHSAAVNYLMNSDEADRFLCELPHKNFNLMLENAAGLLYERGYSIPELTAFEPPKISAYPELSKRQALFAAVEQADGVGGQAQQTLVGIDEGESPLDIICLLSEALPDRIRRKLSFTLGAESVAEATGVVLGIFRNQELSQIIDSNSFEGAMGIQRLIFLNGAFVIDTFLTERVKSIASLPPDKLELLKNLFAESDDAQRYIGVGSKIADGAYDAELIELMGEELSVRAVRQDFFPRDFIKLLYKNRKKLWPDLSAEVMYKAQTLKMQEELSKKQSEDKEQNKAEKEISPEEAEKKKQRKKSIKTLARRVLQIFLILFTAAFMVAVPVLLFFWALAEGLTVGEGFFGTQIQFPLFVYILQLIILTVAEVPSGILLFGLLRRLFKKK